jgi:AhpD family alkylhydroperoxidase
MNINLQEVDPALALMGEFATKTNGTVSAINGMRQKAIYADGRLPARFKALAALLWSISARCEPCIKYYVHKAVELGATEDEIGEICAVASTMGGCVGEMWALKAYAAGKSGETGDESCCALP